MPHEATVEHSDTVKDPIIIPAERARDAQNTGKDLTHIRPPTPEKEALNFDADSSDEGDDTPNGTQLTEENWQSYLSPLVE